MDDAESDEQANGPADPTPAAPRPAPGPRPGSGTGPGRRAAQASRSDYRGCSLWAGGFLVLIIVSFAVGVVLRPDSEATDGSEAVTLAGDVGGDGAYTIAGRTDELGDPCLTLRRDGEEVTGQCGSVPDASTPTQYVVTSSLLEDGRTVAFGPVPGLAEAVRLSLADDTEATVDVRRSQTLGFSWFMYVSDQAVVGSAAVLDGDGDLLRPG